MGAPVYNHVCYTLPWCTAAGDVNNHFAPSLSTSPHLPTRPAAAELITVSDSTATASLRSITSRRFFLSPSFAFHIPSDLYASMQGFEESYVLESTDGLGYTQIKPLPPPPNESEDDRLARLRRLQADQHRNHSLSSLRQQLAEQRERKDEEWKEAHNPFKPPRGLDGDEVGWLLDEDDRRRDRERRRKEEEEHERLAFELAVAKHKADEAQQLAQAASKQQQAAAVGAGAGGAALLPATFSFAETDGGASTSPTSGASTAVGGRSGLGVVRVKRKDETTSRQPPAAEKVKRAKSTGDDTRVTQPKPTSSASSPPPPTSSPPSVTSASHSSPPSSLPSTAIATPNVNGASLSSLLLSYGDDEDD